MSKSPKRQGNEFPCHFYCWGGSNSAFRLPGALPGEIGAVWATLLAEGGSAVLAVVLFAVFLKRFGKKLLAA